MNLDRLEGNWMRLAGQLKAQWDKLTDDDIGRLGSGKDQLAGLLQNVYGVAKDEAQDQIDRWTSTLGRKARRASARASRASEAAGDWLSDATDEVSRRASQLTSQAGRQSGRVVDEAGRHADRLADEAARGAHELAQRQGRGTFKNLLLLTVASALIGMYFSGK